VLRILGVGWLAGHGVGEMHLGLGMYPEHDPPIPDYGPVGINRMETDGLDVGGKVGEELTGKYRIVQ
jgi:hypothetical protein